MVVPTLTPLLQLQLPRHNHCTRCERRIQPYRESLFLALSVDPYVSKQCQGTRARLEDEPGQSQRQSQGFALFLFWTRLEPPPEIVRVGLNAFAVNK